MRGSAVVVGAGIGGLCAATGLDRAGWSVTVVERWPEVVGIGAGLGIWPDAQQALDGLGVGDAFGRRAIPFGTTSLFTKDGRRLSAVPSARVERRAGRPIKILRRADLVSILLDAASSCSILTDVDVSDRPDLIVGPDVVIGADGLRSTVRRTCFPDQVAAPRHTGMVAWRGSAPFELDEAAYGETWGDGALFGLTRLAQGATNWYAAVPTGRDTDLDFAQATERFLSWRSPIPSVLEGADPNQVLRHPIEDLDPHLSSYVSGRTALIGDAAHAMTPNLGRGACEAILDAAELVARLRTADDVPSALSNYDRVRRPPTRRGVQRSRHAMRVATTRHTGPRNSAVRMVSPLIH